MARVKIKSQNPKDPRRRTKILEILSCNDVYVTRLIPVNDGFVIITSNNNEMDKIFNKETDKQLQENDFWPQIPAELTSNRSVLLFRVDNHIHDNTERSIKEEIQRQNEWVGELTKVSKFEKGNIIKVTFNETQKARKAQETGLKLFSMKIPQYDIKQDEYIGILTCMRCYQMEDHSTAQCTQERSYKICSECSSHDHIWRDCEEGRAKKCISCNGPHSTLAMGCPKRKAIVNQKRKEQKEKGSTTYSETLKRNTSRQPQVIQNQPVNTTENGSERTTIYQAMLHSHFVNVGRPGSYSQTFNNLMVAHNLPTLNIQEDPPSLEIITRLSAAEANLTPTNTQPESMDTTERQPENQVEAREQVSHKEKAEDKLTPTNTQIDNMDATERQSEIQAEAEEVSHDETENTQQIEINEIMQETLPILGCKKKHTVRGEEIGLMIYTKQSAGWPQKEDFTRQVLLKGLKDRKFKYTYTKKELSDDDIMSMIANKMMDITAQCFSIIDDSTFGKIRVGLMEEKTPPPSKERRRKNSNSK